MKKTTIGIFFLAIFAVTITISSAEATPVCGDDGRPANIGDPACYVSSSTTKRVFDHYDCVWEWTGNICCKDAIDDNGETYRAEQYNMYDPKEECSEGFYQYWAPLVYNSCTDTTSCGNQPGVHEGEGWNPVYKSVKTTTNTCYYITVDEWSECDELTGLKSATSVSQHSISGTECDNLNEDSIKECGVCNNTPSEAPYSTKDDACQFGSFNSVWLDGDTLKWKCGTGDENKHIGSFNSTNKNDGGEVVADYYNPTSGGTTNCGCVPNYTYNCVDNTVAGSCDGRCGLTVTKTFSLVKTDTSCFPNQYLEVTEQDKINNPCPDVQAKCPPCGSVNGETDVINEVN